MRRTQKNMKARSEKESPHFTLLVIWKNGARCLLWVVWVGLLCSAGYTALGQYSGGIVIPKGYVQLQGDIITTVSNAAVLLGKNTGPQRNFSYAPDRLWPNRVVPYDFEGNDNSSDYKNRYTDAMKMWSNSFSGAVTVTFKPRAGEAGYIHFKLEDPGFIGGTTDYVGYNGGQVTIVIHPDVIENRPLIAHEIGHALGLWHEQSRDDRDAYVTILYNNIINGDASQFDKQNPESTFGKYDYDSIMHYFSTAFSICSSPSCADASCVTISVPQYSGQQCKIGQQNHLSAMDKRGMAFRYAPPDWKFLYAKNGSTENGSVGQPYTTMSQAVSGVPANGTLWLGPGDHSAAGMTITTPMTLKAALADLQMQPDGSLGPSPSGYSKLK